MNNNMAGPLSVLHVRDLLTDLLELHDVTVTKSGALIFRGRLRLPSDEAYRLAAERLRPLSCTPILYRRGEDDVIQVLPQLLGDTPSRNWVGALLFGLTVLSVLFVGALMSGWDMASPWGIVAGIPFAATLLGILGAHELGHYFVSRHYGVPNSLPYFIPMPFGIFGTMGAVIRLKAPPTNRRVLLAIAAAGPLCGLAVALPLLVLGLKLSTVGPVISGGVQEGNSLLYAALKYLIFGRWLPGGGQDVLLHPVAFAAWGGLFVTALNLIPAGQLDGGHILYVLIGERAARYVTYGLVVALTLLGWLVYDGWFLWALIILFLGRSYATPLDSITRPQGKHIALAVLMLLVFVLLFTPAPLQLL